MAIIPNPERPHKKVRQSPEMKIQASCVEYLWNNYPETRSLFFHVPNEMDRPDANAMLGARRKAEGVVNGVSDTILMLQRHGFGALCVEFKTADGRQREDQKKWQARVEEAGYKYVICRSLEQFKEIIKEYIGR